MQTSGGRIRGSAEFSARVEFGVDHFHPGQADSWNLVDRNTSPVVGDGDGTIFMEGDLDSGALTLEGFIHGVIDDFPDTVHQTALIG